MSEATNPVVVNALTVDVEDYFHAEALRPVAIKHGWDGLPSRVVENTGRVLDLFDREGVRGTFFVLGWVAQREPGLIREIARRGHEIGCHGMSHRLIFSQTREDFRAETRDARALLQDVSGQPVRGYRAATFSITRDSIWALDELVQAGFEYDSSIFPITHDTYGIPSAPVDPYRIGTPSGALIEFPLSTLQCGPLRLPASGGGYFRLLPEFVARWLLARVNHAGRPFIFYMHPWEIDPGQPRFELTLRSRLRHYTNLGGFEARLERLLRDYRFEPLEAMLDGTANVARLEAEAIAA